VDLAAQCSFDLVHVLRVLTVIGTRPEAIKMAPVILELRKRAGCEPVICVTGQHRQMLDQVMALFDFTADVDLDLMRPSQTLNALTGRIVNHLDACFESINPEVVLTHGDTTTAMAATVASFHRGIPVGHVEAGLRTYDMDRPFPEEMNRRIIDVMAHYLFAPTESARQNLRSERVASDRIFVTGNTIVDALRIVSRHIDQTPGLRCALDKKYSSFSCARIRVLVTGHRRESFGSGFEDICDAIRRISATPDAEFVYPVHLNPNVQEPVTRILSGIGNINLIAPIDYVEFVYLLTRANVVITDSGGVQEEAVSLGKWVLVMRDVTERPEGVAAGFATLVGTEVDRIIAGFEKVCGRLSASSGHEREQLIYGDGKAAERIVDVLLSKNECRSQMYELQCAK
jgi:UDP-N-acetylglucosamine 2-epimerase (non-hydrolysing)